MSAAVEAMSPFSFVFFSVFSFLQQNSYTEPHGPCFSLSAQMQHFLQECEQQNIVLELNTHC